jgi:hypothetical protein
MGDESVSIRCASIKRASDSRKFCPSIQGLIGPAGSPGPISGVGMTLGRIV